MKLPAIKGIIRRRLLVNYHVAPHVIQPLLPHGFRPKLHAGFAIAGICLIRLEEIRLPGLPAFLGASSENAAHRVAVVWDDDSGAQREGVYIPRRDTDCYFNQLAGGRLFPGEHHAAKFEVRDTGTEMDFDLRSSDGEVSVQIHARLGENIPWPDQSVFSSLAEASEFFEAGSLGYSATRAGKSLEGMRLKTDVWKIQTMDIKQVHSSWFADERRFPRGSAEFDCALLMRDIPHEWHSEPSRQISESCCTPS